MNSVNLIGKVIHKPSEIFRTKNNIGLFKLVLKVKDENKLVDNEINIKVWESVLKNVSSIETDATISINGKILSFGNIENGCVGNELYANSIFIL